MNKCICESNKWVEAEFTDYNGKHDLFYIDKDILHSYVMIDKGFDNIVDRAVELKINFCPLCGRKL